MNAASATEETQRLAMRRLAEIGRQSSVRAFWGEFIPTMVLMIGTWTVLALVIYPRIVSGWWEVVWVLGCAMLGIWLARAFVLMHDAGHGALAPTRWLNQVIGHACSVFVLTPMLHWSLLHWHHHRSSGNLEKQDGLGDIYTMTASRYLSLPGWQRWSYRMFRHRVDFLMIIPTVMFFIWHRLPFVYFPWARIVRKPKLNELVNIAALDALYVGIGWWVWTHWPVAQPWVMTYLVAFLVTVTIGVTLFYTQHQWEQTYYAHDEQWSFFDSAVKGSMTLRLPFGWMEWCLGYINFHSVHHLKPNLPLYHLPAAHRALRELGIRVAECRLSDLWKTFNHSVWDEQRQRLVSFAELESARQDRSG